MPPNSFMEWVIGQNVIPRPKEQTTRPRRRPVFALELETDNAAEEDTLKLTYPRTGRASTRRPTTTRVQTSANKAVHFNENDGKIQVKTVAVQTNPQPKPKPQPQPKAQPKPSTDSSTLVNTSDDQEITEEEVIEDCPCANCVEAQTKLKKAEKLSKSIKNSAAAVHEKHKAKLAKETESAKIKSDAKKQKSKKKAKKPEKPDSEDDTTESESEADTDTDTESEEEPSKKKKKGSKKSSKKRKDSKKKPGKNLKKNDQDEEDNYSRKATKGSVEVPKRYKKIYEKFKEVTDIDDEVAFDIAMRYNKEKEKEWEKEKKALVEDDETEVGEKLKALMEKFMAEKEANAEQEKLKAAEEKRRIEKKARARARAHKEEKTRIKAELKAKAEAEASKPLPPHNPRPNFRHTRFVLPSESRVLSVEHAIEDPDDPRPNAFYDNKTGTMRLYHGPAYGNPNGMLYPKNYENGHYRRLSVGTPHPRDNAYYNGFQGSPYGEPAPAPAPTPAPAPIPTQGYPQQQRNPPRASDWFQGYDSIPVGKAPDYEKEVDDSLYEREVQKACYSTTKTNPALGVSDRGGRSNVVPANVVPTVETKNEKLGKPQSNYYAPKSSSPKDGSRKSDKAQKTSKDEERVKSPSNGWANQSWGGSKNQGWGGSKNQDWGGSKNQDWGGSKNQDWGVASPNANDNGSRRSSNKKFGGSNEDWGAGTGFDWDAENRHDSPVNPTSPASGQGITSVKNETGNDKKSSDTSKAGSTHHRPTKHLPGSWVSPAPSEVSAASRPAGTIPDNVGPDLTSFKKKTEGKSNNGKKPGKEGWIDADVAQTSGGVFDKDDEEGAGVDAFASGSTGS